MKTNTVTIKEILKLSDLINKVERQNGYVKDNQILDLVNLYNHIYGEKYTNLDREYELIYYYMKLKEYHFENRVEHLNRVRSVMIEKIENIYNG